MAMSYLTESEAPRDFRVSSTESDGHYTKCILCYTVKKNFYCAECVKNGNFVHSSMPYSDRYSEKQVKLIRMRLNRQHVLERCEMLLAPKMKKDTLVTETKQSRDKLDLIRLAIEQRRSIINLKKKELLDLKNHNNELKSKLPRYQKRVSSLGKHAQAQRLELQTKISLYNNQAQSLAALRRSRIRQLTRYIFPIYMSYDSSDSIEDMEFVGSDVEEEPPQRPQLHIVAPWIDINADYSHMQAWAVSQSKESSGPRPRRWPRWRRCTRWRWPPPGTTPSWAGAAFERTRRRSMIGRWEVTPFSRRRRSRRVAPCESQRAAGAAWQAAAAPDELDDPEPPEHLHWPDDEQLEESAPPPPAPSLVTSAAASLASIASVWRGWTK